MVLISLSPSNLALAMVKIQVIQIIPAIPGLSESSMPDLISDPLSCEPYHYTWEEVSFADSHEQSGAAGFLTHATSILAVVGLSSSPPYFVSLHPSAVQFLKHGHNSSLLVYSWALEWG